MVDSLNNPENGGYVKTEKFDKEKTEKMVGGHTE